MCPPGGQDVLRGARRGACGALDVLLLVGAVHVCPGVKMCCVAPDAVSR